MDRMTIHESAHKNNDWNLIWRSSDPKLQDSPKGHDPRYFPHWGVMQPAEQQHSPDLLAITVGCLNSHRLGEITSKPVPSKPPVAICWEHMATTWVFFAVHQLLVPWSWHYFPSASASVLLFSLGPAWMLSQSKQRLCWPLSITL